MGNDGPRTAVNNINRPYEVFVGSVCTESAMMSSYYHPAKEADMAAMTEPLCLERGNVASRVASRVANPNPGER